MGSGTSNSPRRAHRPPRPHSAHPGALAVAVIVLAGGLYAGWLWTQPRYWVGVDQNRVVLNRGIDQHLGPVSLSRIERRTDIAAAALPTSIGCGSLVAWSSTTRADADALLQCLSGASAGLRMVQGPLRPADRSPTTGPGDPEPLPSPPPSDSASPACRPAPWTARPRPRSRRRDPMTVVSRFAPRRGRNVELLLIVAATAIVAPRLHVSRGPTPTARCQQPARPRRRLPRDRARLPPGPAWRYAATPTRSCCPSPPSSNGLGLMIHRLDVAHGRSIGEGMARCQLVIDAGGRCAIAAIIIMRPPGAAPLHPSPPACSVLLLLLPIPAGHRKTGQERLQDLDLPGPFSFQPARSPRSSWPSSPATSSGPATPCPSRDVASRPSPSPPATSASILVAGCSPSESSSSALTSAPAALLRSLVALPLHRDRADQLDHHRPDLFAAGAYAAYLMLGTSRRGCYSAPTPSAGGTGHLDQLAKGLMGMGAGGNGRHRPGSGADLTSPTSPRATSSS